MNPQQTVGAGLVGGLFGALVGAAFAEEEPGLWAVFGLVVGGGVAAGITAAVTPDPAPPTPQVTPPPAPSPSPTPAPSGPPQINVTLTTPSFPSSSNTLPVQAFPGSTVAITLPPGAVWGFDTGASWGGGIVDQSGNVNVGSNPTSGTNPIALVYGGGAGGGSVGIEWFMALSGAVEPGNVLLRRFITTVQITDAAGAAA